MSHNVLITGASGYLGGDLLYSISKTKSIPYNKLYALVRTDSQAKSVREYGAEPLILDTRDEEAVRRIVLDKEITIVYYLISAVTADGQVAFIKALGELKKKTSLPVHFLHTSGAKIFSRFAAAPTNQALNDDDENLYNVQKAQEPTLDMIKQAVATNNTVIEVSEAHGVRSYVFIPCIVYGKSRGFGNPVSIQTVAIVKAAKALRRVVRVDSDRPTWPVCHVEDNSSLYAQLLEGMVTDKSYGYGKNGYYLASSGVVAWDDFYDRVAVALKKKGVIDDDQVRLADPSDLEVMGKALGSSPDFVPVQMGGKCTLTSKKGPQIGWKPLYRSEHILEVAEDEVELILTSMNDE